MRIIDKHGAWGVRIGSALVVTRVRVSLNIPCNQHTIDMFLFTSD